MRTIQFKLTSDEACLVEKMMLLAEYADLTPKQLFLRFIRTKLEAVSKELIAAQPKPKGRPAVLINGLEKKEWVAERVAAYSAAEKMAAHDDPDHEWRDESLKQAMAERCWELAEAGEGFTSYLKTVDGRLYDITFPPIEGEE